MPRGRARASQNRQIPARRRPRGKSTDAHEGEAVPEQAAPLTGEGNTVIPQEHGAETGQGRRIITPTANIDPGKFISIYRVWSAYRCNPALAQQLRPGLVLARGHISTLNPRPDEHEDAITAHDLDREQGLDDDDDYLPPPAEIPIDPTLLQTSVPSTIPPTATSAAAVVQRIVSGRCMFRKNIY